MALTRAAKKRNDVEEEEGIETEKPQEFPEAPKERQGDGVASGEVPTGYYADKDKDK